MKSLKFRRLVLVSDSTKSANQFMFQKRFNLVTGKNNSIGKSSLIKNIFWAVGCEPDFDSTWKALDCKALLEFSINDKNFTLLRVNNSIIFSSGSNEYKRYGKITGDYAELFADLVFFRAKLPNRGDDPKLETPPPAFYFLPFYIDQLRSWVTPWDAFQNLYQYARWKQPIVKYHTGYLTPKHFEIEEEIFEHEAEKKIANEEIKKINTAIAVVEKYIPKSNLAINSKEFEKISIEVKEDLGSLAKEQEDLLNKLSNAQSSRYHLENQLSIAKRAVYEIEKDYEFTVENIEGDEIECPLCGTSHDNSLVSRASILSDKQQAIEQVDTLTIEIDSLSNIIEQLEPKIKEIRSQISKINKKYNRNNASEYRYDLTEIIDSFASSSVQRNVEETKTKKEAFCKKTSDLLQDLKGDQKKLISKNKVTDLSNLFIDNLSRFLFKLDAKGVSLDKVKQPTDYNKLFGSGGAAEGTRAVLAYQLAIFNQIHFVANEIAAPLVIDTPNQQEQADKNYQHIIDLIMNETPSDSQILLCGMDNAHLAPYKKDANVIFLDDSKLLNKQKYSELSKEISEIIESAERL